jgi:hypothetical protein
MSQPKGFAGMFGNAVAKLTDIRPLNSEDIGMSNAPRSAGGKANRVSRKDKRQQQQQPTKRSSNWRNSMSDDIEMKGTVPTGRGKL